MGLEEGRSAVLQERISLHPYCRFAALSFRRTDGTDLINKVFETIIAEWPAALGYPVCAAAREPDDVDSHSVADLVLLRSDLEDVVPYFQHYFWHTDYERWCSRMHH
ncbi:hypothetical protein ABT040_16050 [Streptomyces sp. NPDC002688]|uniref:hypothetical protein n=1 Tax=Streptomyces sp. NPDC002688 TaxID=3154423 RepID=UPI003331EA51